MHALAPTPHPPPNACTPWLRPLATCPQALLVQTVLLLFLVYHFQRRSPARALTLAACLAGAGAVAGSGSLSRSQVAALYDFNNVILIASRCAHARPLLN